LTVHRFTEGDSDLIILPRTFAPVQQLEISACQNISALDLYVVVQMASSLQLRTVKTNTVSILADTSEQLLVKMKSAAVRHDISSCALIFSNIFGCPDITVTQAEEAFFALDSVIRTTSGGPTPHLAILVIRLLHISLVYMVHQGWGVGVSGILATCHGLLVWLATPAGLGGAPLTKQELWSAAQVAENLELLESASGKSSFSRTAVDTVRIVAMQAHLLGWTVGQAPVELYHATGYLRKLPELESSSLGFTADANVESVSPDIVLTLPSKLPEELAGADRLVSIACWITQAGVPHVVNNGVIIISKIFTIEFAPCAGHGTNPKVEIPNVPAKPAIGSTFIRFAYSAAALTSQDQQNIAAGNGISCVLWSVNPLRLPQEGWDDSSCTVVSVEILSSYDSMTGHHHAGIVLCSCNNARGTLAVAYSRNSAMSSGGSPTFNVRWSANTPRDRDELVVSAGSEMLLTISALSETPAPWSSLLVGSAAPCTLSFLIGGDFPISIQSNIASINGIQSSDGATLSLPMIFEDFTGTGFSQLTVWNFSLSPELTLSMRQRAASDPEYTISVSLLEESSGGRLRQWKLRILDCETLVSNRDTLSAIAARYGTSQRILFALNPTLSTPDLLPAPRGGTASVNRWDCDGNRPCTLKPGEAGGMLLRIGRMAQIQANSSVADEVARLGGSLRHVAEQNQGRINVLSLSPLILNMDATHEVCVVIRDEDSC
jgi:hypothetical protein